MSHVLDIASVDRNCWKQLLQSSRVSTWWQSPACYDWFLSCSLDLVPFGAGVMRSEKLVGLVLGYVTKSRLSFVQYFSARAIINGGPLLSDDITTEELALLLAPSSLFHNHIHHQQDGHPIYIETRNFRDYTPWRSIFEQMGWQYCPHYDVWNLIDDQWRNRLHESKVRKIRNTLPNCDIVPLDYSPEREADFDEWYQQLSTLYRNKVHRPLLSREALLSGWKLGMTLLLVKSQINHPSLTLITNTNTNTKHPSSVMGGVLFPHDHQWAYEYYVCGPTIVTYAMLYWCEQQGIQYVDMMGAGEPDVPYGVRDFKLQMGGSLQELGRFLFVYSPFRYYLGKLALRFRSFKMLNAEC